MNYKTIFQRAIQLIFLEALIIVVISCSKSGKTDDHAQSYSNEQITAQMDSLLKDHMLEVWYPRCLDTVHGGYLTDFSYDWKSSGPQHKFIVTQARHLWTSSVAAEYFPDEPVYRRVADHGFEFLKNVMRDSVYGGYFNIRNREGGYTNAHDFGDDKRTYGNAFVIYGLSAYARLTGSEEALDLAKENFRWLETHSYDPEYGGYFEFLTREGTPYHLSEEEEYKDDSARYSYKDQNTMIHMLEAYSELYHIWPNDTLQQRLNELLVLVRDTIVTDKGYMNLFFTPDWQHVSYKDSAEVNYLLDHVSFGHDIETAYLMLEASEILGLEDDHRTLEVAKKLADHTIANGIDESVGGIYDAGYYYSDTITIVKDTKNWWSQAEGLNTLLMFQDLYPEDEIYKQSFDDLWDYTTTYFIDWEHGGWYQQGIDKEPEFKKAKKAQIWKGPYHTTRSIMNCLRRLEGIED